MADWTQPFEAAYVWRRVARDSYRQAPYGIGREVGDVGNVTAATITVNADSETYESATADCVGPLAVGTDLVRCHLLATFADGTTEDVVLGTFDVSVPSRKVRGSFEECRAVLDGRLIELAEDAFEAPYPVLAAATAQSVAVSIAEGAGPTVATPFPVSYAQLGAPMTFGLDGSEDDDGSRLWAVNQLLAVAGDRAASTNEYGSIVLQPPIDYSATPVWTFREGINATFLAEAEDEADASKVANVVIATYETSEATVRGVAVDSDPSSPYSTVSLGWRRAKRYRYNDGATQAQANAKAAELLAQQQSVVRRVTLQHVWCGARVGDVVAVDYPSAGISGSFAVRAQTIEVGSAGCLCKSELRRFERG